METDIYKLKLHEIYVNNGFSVLRVPGFWIYNFFNASGEIESTVPIPYNEEFKPKQSQLTIDELPAPKKFDFKKSLIQMGVDETVASDWMKVRAKKKAANTETAFNGLKNQILLTTAKPNDCVKLAVVKSWSGFKAEWYFNENGKIDEPIKKTATKF